MTLDNLFESLYKSIFPIIYFDDKNDANVLGTSILVEYRKIPYLITAAHSLRCEIGREYPLYVLLSEEAVFLPGPAYMTKSPSDDNPLDLDIAVFPINSNSDLRDRLTGYKTVPLHDFDDSIEFAREHYFIFGYPWRRSKYNRYSNELEAKPLSCFTDRITRDSLYEKYNTTPETHILVKYSKRNMKDNSGQKRFAPKPHGISGGPLSRALINENDQLIVIIFEGLLTEWQDNDVIIATRKSEIRSFIESGGY